MKRVQRKRTKGWKMPANTVYVGRPTKWGNPVIISDFTNESNLPNAVIARHAVQSFESLLQDDRLDITVDEIKKELQGKDLACWCALDQPCHADVLLEIANEGEYECRVYSQKRN
ncbi:MAG: DUF4326 domain-containing protein [SAR324 cluster bacterium]|nr:DUF4326 domain-containing protein [SAR324 cluster bacterium]